VFEAYAKPHKVSGEPSLPVDSVPLSPRKRLSKSPVTPGVSNKTDGMQTTKESKPGSVKKAEGRGQKDAIQCGLLTHTDCEPPNLHILVGGLNPWLSPVAQRVQAFWGRWGPLWG